MPMNSGKNYKARTTDVSQPLMAGGPVGGNQGGDYISQPVAYRTAGDGAVFEEGDKSAPLTTGTDPSQITSKTNRSQPSGAVCHTIPAASTPPHVAQPYAVRRLTPTECERLQGMPDGWTEIPWRGKPANQCPDGPRYKALGNSWAVNCGEFIFDRIKAVEGIAAE